MDLKSRPQPVPLKALARAYLAFAQQHRNLWQTLFALKMAEGAPTPDIHVQELVDLLGFIAGPLRQLEDKQCLPQVAMLLRKGQIGTRQRFQLR
ncbi:MAG: TetR-like C-terminal domain-containing protein, partial [Pseudomonadota bacterium]